jgi:hypothetical protein
MRSQKSLWCLVLTVAAVLFLVGTQLSLAQMPGIPNMPKIYGEFKMPPVGSYVTYKTVLKGSTLEKTTKLSIVGKEKSDKGTDIYWYEIEDIDNKTGTGVITKMLISGNPSDIGTVYKMIIKQGKDQAWELPQGMIQLINASPTPKVEVADQPKIKNVGTEKVKIKDQAMDCAHMRYLVKDKTTADVWNNTKVPLFGMVKMVTPDASFELLNYGTNATTAITEQPKMLEIPEQK